MPEIYVGVGSNVNAAANVTSAVAELMELFPGVQISSIYRSPAFGFAGDDFLNLVVRFVAATAPQALIDTLHDVERRAGRLRPNTGPGPRSLDLDLLMYGSRVDAEWRLPHPDILRYPFVLGPLAELAPGLLHPLTGVPMRRSWRAMALERPRLHNLGPLAALPASFDVDCAAQRS